ncbi:hypothetical protein BCF74_13815 [Knoellia remsis]|uniref:Uncharacterized protein n=1 Tax=Knoellia remsis TaxID=407159 RepID=A0A2T0TYR9_9MICO|nr:hypothetical protein [Knoellia remsis]PRY50793.1 hypothetical protein BCF74_13815 [Knoellia remsis]
MADFPSLDIVRAEFDVRLEEQTRLASAFDTRAGVVVGFSGVLIGLSASTQSWFHFAAQVLAAVAAGVALWAIWFRVAGSVDPRALRNAYLNSAPEVTKLRVLDTKIWLFEQDEVRFRAKVRRLTFSLWLLGGAVLLLLLGSTVEVFG